MSASQLMKVEGRVVSCQLPQKLKFIVPGTLSTSMSIQKTDEVSAVSR